MLEGVRLVTTVGLSTSRPVPRLSQGNLVL